MIYNFGVPGKGYYLQRSVDIKRSVHAVGGKDSTVRAAFISNTGAVTSYLESSILEQLVRNWQGTGFSAVQVLMDANRQGIPIYQIDANNRSQVLPLLAINDTDVMSDINNVLDVGLEVIVPQRVPAKAVGVSGIGYMLRDPVTEAAAYRISGGLNGGAGEAPCAVRELRPLTQAIQDIVLTALVLAAAAALVTVGPAAPPVAALMAGVGLGALTFEATAGEFCNPIPSPRRGGNAVHNDCADKHPRNEFLGSDVCVSDGINQRNFDAISGGKTVLWEAKTDNLDNWARSKRPVFAKLVIFGQWKKTASAQSPIAKNCKFQYRFVVGDSELAAGAQADTRLAALVDKFEVDAPLCLQPWTGIYPQR